MSSPNNHHEQWSPSSIRRHGSLERRRRQQELDSICVDRVHLALPSIGQQLTTARAIQVTDEFQQLQVRHDSARASTQPVTRTDRSALMVNRLQNESLAENQLIERLKELINQFMQRPGRQLNYNNTIRWTVDHGNDTDYSVVILINQPYQII